MPVDEELQERISVLVDNLFDQIEKGPNYVEPEEKNYRPSLKIAFAKDLQTQREYFYKGDRFVDSLLISKE